MTPSSPRRSRAVLLTVLAVGLGLSGCVSLFPASKPVQLYRFGQSAPAPTAPAPAGLTIAKGVISFPSDAAGDALLTVTGAQAAFIADARWIEPASLMFDQALTAGFDQPGSPRLAGRGEGLGAASTLRLDVRRFQTDYDQGLGAAPTVEVTVHAVLIQSANRSLLAEKLFEVREPAAENRVSAIVAAYDKAVGEAVADVRDWTAATAR